VGRRERVCACWYVHRGGRQSASFSLCMEEEKAKQVPACVSAALFATVKDLASQ